MILRRVAAVLALNVAVVAAVGGVALHAATAGSDTGAGVTDWWLVGVATTLAFAGTGTWLCVVQPRLAIGWLLLAIGVAAAVSMASLEYGVYGLDNPGRPGSEFSLWIGNWLWSSSLVSIVALIPPLLPDGRLPMRPWRAVMVLGATSVLAVSLLWALTPYEAWSPALAQAGATNPVGREAVVGAAGQALFLLLTVVGPVVSVGALVMRWRRAADATRQQLKWILLGVASALVLFGSGFVLGPVFTALAVLPLPVAVVVAVLRHGLWDVDVLISRSMIYAALTLCILAVYVAVVGSLGGLLGRTTGAPVLATALVAVAVQPVHERLRRLVNRMVHGSVEDPFAALSRVGSRLEAAYDASAVAEEMLPELVSATVRALHLPHVAVELADGTVISHGQAGNRVERIPLRYGGQSPGSIVVTLRPAGLGRRDRDRLTRLADQAGVAAHSLLLARAVRRSGEQLVSAREEERRNLYRELHDGLGPSLAALALNVEVARDLLAEQPQRAAELLDRALPRLKGTVSDVRSVVLGLRPPTLDDLGLAGAVRELAAGFAGPTLTVHVEISDDLSGLPAATEVATYRIVAEALTNASRHAQASSITVRVDRRGGVVSVGVLDDGQGITVGRVKGIGLDSMAERAREVGGQLHLALGAGGRGTAVRAVLPAGAP